jgi:hypothetical protein
VYRIRTIASRGTAGLARLAGRTEPGRRRAGMRHPGLVVLAVVVVVGVLVIVNARVGNTATVAPSFEVQSLDGGGNNQAHRQFGQAGTAFPRVADANYADGRSTPVDGPNPRTVSNRVFNDLNQSVFSNRQTSQWAAAWAQFIESDIARADPNGQRQDIKLDRNDPLESFTDADGVMNFTRSKAAAGTGANNPREQINTASSFLDASPIYGESADRLEFLRAGPVDGNLANNSALLLLPGGQLPRRDARGNAGKAPTMTLSGRLAKQPGRAAVAGDPDANQSLTRLAIDTLFAREHNRIVSRLPSTLSEEQRFQLARRVVIAEEQYITYNEFLPALGVRLGSYHGYNPRVDAAVGNEFATVGSRVDSLFPGELTVDADANRFEADQLKAFQAKGISVARPSKDEVAAQVPLNVSSFNPDLLPDLQLGVVLQGLADHPEERGDELIDNQLRSVLFQSPSSTSTGCLSGPTLARCFRNISDLGAIDVERGRDHGMPGYNDLRRAFGLAPRASFEAITGEKSDDFAADPLLTVGQEINDPNSLDFVRLRDADGKPVADIGDHLRDDVVSVTRRTPLAARLKAIYGSVDKMDALVGMMSEPQERGSELGELQQTMWRDQFEALRDGDRFFFQNQPVLGEIKQRFGIDFRVGLADIIAFDTDVRRADLDDNVFQVPSDRDREGRSNSTSTRSSQGSTSSGDGTADQSDRDPSREPTRSR